MKNENRTMILQITDNYSQIFPIKAETTTFKTKSILYVKIKPINQL